MPLDRATVRWGEQASPPVHVATLILPRQDLTTRGQSEYGENLAFNTWHALPEHEPVGSIAAARKVVYQASADVRRNFNATPLGEPTGPRPAEWKPGVPYPPGKDARVVRAAIHPAIGVARVGNSPAGFFVGPEVTEPAPEKPGFYRDATGALKRQAARFRIYGYNAAGEVVGELTADTADIRWTVHVANRKAAWYQWTMALDIPEAAGSKIPLRNKSGHGRRAQGAGDRRRAEVDRRARALTARRTSSAASSRAPTSTSARSGPTTRAGSCSWAATGSRRPRPGARSSTRATRTGSSTPTAGTTTCPTGRSPPR